MEASDRPDRPETNGQRRARWARDNGSAAPYTLKSITERDGGTCAWCLGPVGPALSHPDPRLPSIEHIVELSQGGTDHPDNVALAHLFCNTSRPGDRMFVSPAYMRWRLARRVRLGPHAMSWYGVTQDQVDAWEDGREERQTVQDGRHGRRPG
ncbi:HNH endonuclease [Streptomyces sp. NPDC054949]